MEWVTVFLARVSGGQASAVSGYIMSGSAVRLPSPYNSLLNMVSVGLSAHTFADLYSLT